MDDMRSFFVRNLFGERYTALARLDDLFIRDVSAPLPAAQAITGAGRPKKKYRAEQKQEKRA